MSDNWNEMPCPKCGTMVEINNFGGTPCPKCGTEVSSAYNKKDVKRKTNKRKTKLL